MTVMLEGTHGIPPPLSVSLPLSLHLSHADGIAAKRGTRASTSKSCFAENARSWSMHGAHITESCTATVRGKAARVHRADDKPRYMRIIAVGHEDQYQGI